MTNQVSIDDLAKSSTDPYENICNAVIIQSILDYKKAITINDVQMIEEVENFFENWAWYWNGMNGKLVLYYLRSLRKRGDKNV